MSNQATGTVKQIFGPVVDVAFSDADLPAINDAVRVPRDGSNDLVLEVAQHLGDELVRCVAMASTDGLQRGAEAISTGAPIMVPVGECTTGRVFNLLGQPLDALVKGDVDAKDHWPIHRPAPSFDEQDAVSEVFETGLKVVDLLCPFAKGGKIGL
ncbi:MAG: F0F1 ATP synthase subunit beta, partial [Planctomycetes bacterium]|nr:F0F1 ATP synthase subunit beta [Planctomycetota bacterium]